MEAHRARAFSLHERFKTAEERAKRELFAVGGAEWARAVASADGYERQRGIGKEGLSAKASRIKLVVNGKVYKSGFGNTHAERKSLAPDGVEAVSWHGARVVSAAVACCAVNGHTHERRWRGSTRAFGGCELACCRRSRSRQAAPR